MGFDAGQPGHVPQKAIPSWLLKVIVLGNLVGQRHSRHTRITYHRTWETGLEVAA